MHTDHSSSIKKLRRHAKAVLREAILEPGMMLDDEMPDSYFVSVASHDSVSKKLHDIHGLARVGKLSARKPAKAFVDEQ